MIQRRAAWSLLISVSLLAGCDRQQIQVYRVKKETPMVGHAHGHASPAMPQLSWKLPAGWEERGPDRMTIARFAIQGHDGKQGAEVSIMPMPSEGASNLKLLVDIVRKGAGLGPIGDEELSKLVESVHVGDESASLVDLSGATAASGDSPQDQIILTVFTRAGMTWFFKMSGTAAVVSSQKGAYRDFLKSIAFRDASESSGATVDSSRRPSAPQTAGSSDAKPQWAVPQNWREVPPTQMLQAKFLLAGPGEAKAEVTVSVLGGGGGGLLPNMNRWRTQQLGLPEVAESDVSRLVSPLDGAEGKALLVDMTGQDPKTQQKARLVVVILSQTDRTWFYKLMGDEAVVEKEKQAFLKFVQTAKHPNAA
jgi:hypothetical protein